MARASPPSSAFTLIEFLGPSGLTVPMWYCPFRPDDFSADDDWCRANRGHSLASLPDLVAAVARAYNPDFQMRYYGNFYNFY